MLAIVLAVTAPILAQDSSKGDDTPAGYTKVTGADLPEWRIWRSVFRALAREDSWLPGSIDVAPEQRAVIVAVAGRSAAAEADNTRRQQQRLAELQARRLKASEIKSALYEIDYELRVRTLQDRDALLLRLTPDARAALESWVIEHRKGATSFVPTIDLDTGAFPHRPRHVETPS